MASIVSHIIKDGMLLCDMWWQQHKPTAPKPSDWENKCLRLLGRSLSSYPAFKDPRNQWLVSAFLVGVRHHSINSP